MHYIYIIKANNNLKIGITKDLDKRLASLQTGNGCKLRYQGYVETPTREKALLLEKELHKHFKESRQVSEWFTLSTEKVKKHLNFLGYELVTPVLSCYLFGLSFKEPH